MDALRNALSTNEIRYLRDQLNKTSLNKDICGSLPLEILLMVIDYLDLEDFENALHVSSRWQEVFSAPELSVKIVKNYFPWEWRLSYQSLEGEEQAIALKESLPLWLRDAASTYTSALSHFGHLSWKATKFFYSLSRSIQRYSVICIADH